jgi:7-cyano-7-deazaguanine synthase
MGGETNKNAVVLLSGGLDSATVLAIATADGFRCHAISFRYGQRHEGELEAAALVAEAIGAVEHVIVDIDLAAFGGSALTADLEVPKHDTVEEIGDGIPVTYVPARNTVFLSMALAFAETRDASHIFIGVNALDYSGYPDCRPEFIEAFQAVATLGTKAGNEIAAGISIHAPLIHMGKADIIRKGRGLGVDYSITTSCYDPVGRLACGQCDACLLRRKGFQENDLDDPIDYQ